MPRVKSSSRGTPSLSLAMFFAAAAVAAAADTPTPSPTPSPEPSPEASPPAPTPLEVTAFADAYYGWSFNRTDRVLRNFDTNHDAFSINLVEVALEKRVSPGSRVGFRADLDFGPTADAVASLEPSGSGEEIFKHLQQGYMSVLAGSKLQLDFGKFVTPHGAELIESKDNWNYSRSLLFALAIPYYHVGLRAILPVNDKVILGGFAVNGWNNITESNTGKTFGFQACIKPNGNVTWIGNYMRGPEQTDDNDDIRHLFDSTVIVAATPKLSLMANYDYGSDRVGGLDVSWQGVAVYARYQATPYWAVSPRYEWVKDGDGFMTGTSQRLQEFTFTSEFVVAESLLARLEYRRDFSDELFFTGRSGEAKKSQSTVTVGVMYAFGGKI